MELRELKNLWLIVKHGSLKEAAKRSFLTPAAVSLQIKSLEQELGVKIFELKSRKLSLTAQGEVFYYEARKVLEAVHEASEKAKHSSSDFSGKNIFGCPGLLALLLLAEFRAFSRFISFGQAHDLCEELLGRQRHGSLGRGGSRHGAVSSSVGRSRGNSLDYPKAHPRSAAPQRPYDGSRTRFEGAFTPPLGVASALYHHANRH